MHMPIQELNNQLLKALGQDHLDDAFGLLLDHVTKEGPHWSQLDQLRDDYNLLKAQILQRNINLADRELESNRLSTALLNYADSLQDEDIRPEGAYSAKLIRNPILILTHHTEQSQEVTVFAKMLKFSQVTVRNLMAYTPTDQAYDLVVFDNTDLPPCASEEAFRQGKIPNMTVLTDRLDLMERYLKQTHYYFIHYGANLFYVEQHRDRMLQATTRFELYTRIRELLRFLEAFQV